MELGRLKVFAVLIIGTERFKAINIYILNKPTTSCVGVIDFVLCSGF